MHNQKRFVQTILLPILAFSIPYLVLVLWAPNQYYQSMLTLVCVWATLGISWNILSGYSGLISFGHAAFFGLGAYTVALASVIFNISPWFGVPLAGVFGAIAGLVVGVPTFKLRGHYFGLAMLAYPLAMLYVFEWLGYQEVTIPLEREHPAFYMQYSDGRVYGMIGLALLVIAILISKRIETTRFGMSLLAIKQNELAAEAAGINTRKWKLYAIAISGAIAGIAGGFYAVVLVIVTPDSAFGLLTSSRPLILTLFGGVGTVWGPLIGATILIPLSEFLNAEFGSVLPGVQGVVFGISIVLIILLAPEGIFWKIRDRISLRHDIKIIPVHSKQSVDVTDISPLPDRPNVLLGATLLDIRGLTKSYGGLKANQKITFTVPTGSVIGIIGPNGAGKTTLFNLLNGLQRPDEGEIFFQGQNIVGLDPNTICKRGIGRTFQVARPFKRLSILENVLVGAFVQAESDKIALLNAQEALQMVGLHGTDRLAETLSGKDQRLMELARALAGKPKLILLDEIFAGLGAKEINEIIPLIRKFSENGMTILIIEHTMQAMLRLVDHFIVLDHGAVLTQGKPQKVLRDSNVIEAYLGKKWRDRAQNS